MSSDADDCQHVGSLKTYHKVTSTWSHWEQLSLFPSLQEHIQDLQQPLKLISLFLVKYLFSKEIVQLILL